MSRIRYSHFDSPVGRLLLFGRDKLEGISFPTGSTRIIPETEWVPDNAGFKEAADQLAAYFKGELKAFNLAMDLKGTPFQKQVWEELARIPYGETISYGQLADRVGNPKAARAVGMANKKNPIPIIIPCHRVIGKNGRLTGFGGGIDIKAKLLELEKKHA